MEIKTVKSKKTPKGKKESKIKKEIYPKEAEQSLVSSLTEKPILKAEETSNHPKFGLQVENKLREKYSSRLKIFWFVIVIIIFVVFYFLDRTDYLKIYKFTGNIQTQNQALTDDQKVLVKLKKIILLSDELQPTMAIITNVDTLKQKQPVFFADAKNGDRLIIYPELAIIYDQEANKIIKIGPVQTVAATSTK